MSILVQKHDDLPSSQSPKQRQRPSHKPPRNLSQNEIQCLYDLLGNNCVTLATAVAQILYGYDNIWKKQACGVLCFVKDYSRRVYCFRLYNLRSKEPIYEEITFASLCLEKASDILYTFNGMKCKVGINFVDQIEAETFCKHFHEKQVDRQKKMKIYKSTNTSISAVMNGIKVPTKDTIKTSIPTSSSNKKFKSKSLRQKDRLVISEPITPSFSHIMHVGHGESFVTDNAKQELFEEVIKRMNMSPEEEIYIRSAVKNTNNGLDKLFTKSTRDDDTQRQQISNDAPAIPPRTYPPLQRNNNNRISYQDISMPSSTYHETSKTHPQLQNIYNTPTDSKRSTPPAVPPKPVRRVPDNTRQSIQTSRASPPPIPTDSQNQTQNPGVPSSPPMPTVLLNQTQNPSVPPPPPSSPPVFVSEQMTNESPTSSSNSEHNSLNKEICNFNTVRLKPASQRPTALVKSTENDSALDKQQTMEENIRKMLEKRRRDIMPDDDEQDESDSSGDEWFV